MGWQSGPGQAVAWYREAWRAEKQHLFNASVVIYQEMAMVAAVLLHRLLAEGFAMFPPSVLFRLIERQL